MIDFRSLFKAKKNGNLYHLYAREFTLSFFCLYFKSGSLINYSLNLLHAGADLGEMVTNF